MKELDELLKENLLPDCVPEKSLHCKNGKGDTEYET